MCHMGAAQRRLQLIAASEVSGLQTNTAQLSLSLSLSLSLLLSRTHRCPPNWSYLWGLCQRSRHLFEFKYQHIIYGGAVSSKPHQITRQGYLTNALTELNSDSPRPASTHTHTHSSGCHINLSTTCGDRIASLILNPGQLCRLSILSVRLCPLCVAWPDSGQSGSLSWLFQLSQVFDFDSGDNRARMWPGQWPLERDMRWEIYRNSSFFLLNVPLTLMRQFQWDGFV